MHLGGVGGSSRAYLIGLVALIAAAGVADDPDLPDFNAVPKLLSLTPVAP
jgi:hypothetical protein